MKQIRNKDLKSGKLVARRYRNRRIGEFLKELDLTEGRCTGIPIMIRAMRDNGSLAPEFETDKARTYFITRLRIHVEAQVELIDTQIKVLLVCEKQPLSSSEIAKELGHSGLSGNIKKAINDLLKYKFINLTIPEKPKSSKQKYIISKKGMEYIRRFKQLKLSSNK